MTPSLFPGFRHAAGALSLALASWLGTTSGVAETSVPIELRHVPLLFVDDAPLVSQRGIVRTIHPARTRPVPVLQAERPWEGDRVYTYGSVAYDPAEKLFRLWYMSRSQRPGGSKPAPQLRGDGQDVVLLATSRDGVSWDRPNLGLHRYDDSTANNIVADFHSPAVSEDRFERDAAKRFKMLGYYRGGYYSSYSADGVKWKLYSETPVFKGNDTMSMTQNPHTGEFMAYFKMNSKEVPGRVVWLTRSRDLQKWTEPKLVFHSDAEDRSWGAASEPRTEVYNMAVYPHAAGFIGFPTMFRVMSRAPKDAKLHISQSGHDGPIDVQLTTSTDGEKWQRTWPRVNVIPRGAPGTFDGGAILGVSSNCIDVGDETWSYYTALTTGHGGIVPVKRLTIGRAEWRRHGFASLDASPAGGRIETRPLRFASGTLLVNADASRGQLRIALVEADGKPVPGRSIAECEPLRGDQTRWEARWRDGRTVPTDRPLRVAIEMTSTRLYSLAVPHQPAAAAK